MRKILVLVICILLASTASVAMAAVYNPPVEWTASREANHPEEWTHFIHEIPLDGTDPTGTLLDFRTPEADVKAELAALEARTGVKVATGATVTKAGLMKEDTHRTIDVTQPPYNAQIWTIDNWGSTAAEAQIGARNTRAINQALIDLSNEGGGTLYFPPGVYRTYTICLRSDVNIKLDKGAVIAAARPTTDGGATGGSVLYGYTENGTGAIVTSINNCPQPEVNLFIGFQDGGHTYFANSLIYGYGVKNVMIYGEGSLWAVISTAPAIQ
ncbi:MAG: hypothetical protein FWH55_13515 [Oscillospiraceae bacterium]|nr:hypothetical protein [Oscillospiraceae bacterium]